MNKNAAIKIAIVVICFGGTGLVLYFGMFRNKRPAPPVAAFMQGGGPQLGGGAQPVIAGGVSALEDILPNGGTLDFSKVIDRNRFRYHLAEYPKLNPNTEVGVSINALILPAPKQ